jgi:hypothetical protein
MSWNLLKEEGRWICMYDKHYVIAQILIENRQDIRKSQISTSLFKSLKSSLESQIIRISRISNI